MYARKQDPEGSFMTPRAVAFDIIRLPISDIGKRHLDAAKKAKKAVTINQTLIGACITASRVAFEQVKTSPKAHLIDKACTESFNTLMEPATMRRQLGLMLTCLRLGENNIGYANPLLVSREDLMLLLDPEVEQDQQFPLTNASRLNTIYRAFNDIGRTNWFTEAGALKMWDVVGVSGKIPFSLCNPLKNDAFKALRDKWTAKIDAAGSTSKRAVNMGLIALFIAHYVATILSIVHQHGDKVMNEMEDDSQKVERLRKAMCRAHAKNAKTSGKKRHKASRKDKQFQSEAEEAAKTEPSKLKYREIRSDLLRATSLLLIIVFMATQIMRGSELTGLAMSDFQEDMGLPFNDVPVMVRAFFPVNTFAPSEQMFLKKFLGKWVSDFIMTYPDNKPACATALSLPHVFEFCCRILIRLEPNKLFNPVSNPDNLIFCKVKTDGEVDMDPDTGRLTTAKIDSWMKMKINLPPSILASHGLTAYSARCAHAIILHSLEVLKHADHGLFKDWAGHTHKSNQLKKYARTIGRILGLPPDSPEVVRVVNRMKKVILEMFPVD